VTASGPNLRPVYTNNEICLFWYCTRQILSHKTENRISHQFGLILTLIPSRTRLCKTRGKHLMGKLFFHVSCDSCTRLVLHLISQLKICLAV
jgi:hypothetical protein